MIEPNARRVTKLRISKTKAAISIAQAITTTLATAAAIFLLSPAFASIFPHSISSPSYVIFVMLVSSLLTTPLYMFPSIELNKDWIQERPRGTIFVTNRFLWSKIADFRIVRYTPVTWSLPYERTFVGFNFCDQHGLDIIMKLGIMGRRKVSGVDWLLDDATSAIDSSTYGMKPESLIAMLESYKNAADVQLKELSISN